MEIITCGSQAEWDKIVKSFATWDVYYLSQYVKSLQLHGDGEPLLIYYQSEQMRIAYVVQQTDIADFPSFEGVLDRKRYYDWTTPYGYGGPLIEGKQDETELQKFEKELEQYCKENRIVSQFSRFHPILQNQEILSRTSDVLYLKKTVCIDLADKETIWENMTSNCRQNIRKATRNGIKIFWDHGEQLERFIYVYESTMSFHDAEEYYFFEKQYFQYIIDNLKENMCIFYAAYEEMVVCAALLLYNGEYIHYHLGGTLSEYRNLGAMNLLLYEAAKWGEEKGIRVMHLGGGVQAEDSLLRFKKQFNRNGLLDFCIGKTVFMQEIYDELVEIRKRKDKDFMEKKHLMIEYKS